MVAYYRVSTQKQGRSGLGLSAQKAAIEAYRASTRARIVAEYTEVESGKKNERPQLAKALRQAKVTAAVLVIAKLDRLARSATFLLALRDSGCKFIAADMPDANTLTVGIMALIAQHEREMISQRTREALKAAKRRGQKLGNPHGARPLLRAGRDRGAAAAAIRAKAARHAEDLRPIIAELRGDGIEGAAAIARELNEREIQTPRAARWHPSSVRNLLARLERTEGRA
jgi:DNA invertase Pin-like site-specific DNA recombinase